MTDRKIFAAFMIVATALAFIAGFGFPDPAAGESVECGAWAEQLDHDETLINSIGCDWTGYEYERADGECAEAARRGFRLGLEPFSVELGIYVWKTADVTGDCAIYDDGSWDDPEF